MKPSNSNYLAFLTFISRFCGISQPFQAFQYFKEQQRRLAVESAISPEQVEVAGLQLAICKGYTPMRIWRSETSWLMNAVEDMI